MLIYFEAMLKELLFRICVRNVLWVCHGVSEGSALSALALSKDIPIPLCVYIYIYNTTSNAYMSGSAVCFSNCRAFRIALRRGDHPGAKLLRLTPATAHLYW